MRTTLSSSLSFTLRAAVSAVAVAFATNAFALAGGIGARYGTHDPRQCASAKAPVSGPMTAALARKYFICSSEHEVKSGAVGDLLFLVSDAKVEVGASRPFNPANDSFNSIDVRKPVYPIRGSFTAYYCSVAGSIGAARGANCASADQTVASGQCYNDTFGDWHCVMLGNVLASSYINHQPPPTRL